MTYLSRKPASINELKELFTELRYANILSADHLIKEIKKDPELKHLDLQPEKNYNYQLNYWNSRGLLTDFAKILTKNRNFWGLYAYSEVKNLFLKHYKVRTGRPKGRLNDKTIKNPLTK